MKLTDITKHEAKGRRSYMEDFSFVSYTSGKGVLIGVFDGHGGAETAEFAGANLDGEFDLQINDGAHVEEALRIAFGITERKVMSNHDGSTASVVFIPEEGNTIYTAVLGDSPIIIGIGDQVVFRGPDHNVRTNPAEAEAVVDRGATLAYGYACNGPFGPGLQMARALGDAEFKWLSKVPEINAIDVSQFSSAFKYPNGEKGFVLVASDGLFDPRHVSASVTADAAVLDLVVRGYADAEALVKHALSVPTGDNVTAILARF